MTGDATRDSATSPLFAMPALVLSMATAAVDVWLVFDTFRRAQTEDENSVVPIIGN